MLESDLIIATIVETTGSTVATMVGTAESAIVLSYAFADS